MKVFISAAVIFIVASLIFLPLVHAQTPASALLQDSQRNTNVPVDLHTWTQNVMIEVAASLSCQLTGVDPVDRNASCLGIDPKTQKIGFVKKGGGVLALVNQAIIATYTNQPLHTSDYLTYMGRNFGLVKPAYAITTPPCTYSIGFCGLTPLLNIWVIFRNFVYLFFALVFVFIGLLIMLRVKIDPRTVMSVQNQIPKIVIGLILVTFSFAIAGFLVDLMYVATSLILNLFASPGIIPNHQVLTFSAPISITNSPSVLTMNAVESQNVLGYFNSLFGVATNNTAIIGAPLQFAIGGGGFFQLWFNGAHAVSVFTQGSFPGPFWDYTLGYGANILLAVLLRNFNPLTGPLTYILKAIQLTGGGQLGIVIAGLTGGLIATPASAAEALGVLSNLTALTFADQGSLGALIGLILIPLALLMALFRILISLIKAYISVLIDVSLAPFFIVMGIFPVENGGFGGWIKGLVAHLAVFPTTLFMLLLGAVFANQFGQPGANGFVPPLIGGLSNQEILGPLITIGILFLIPGAADLIQAAIKAPQSKAGGIIGHGAAAGSPMGVLQQVSTIGFTLSGLSSMPLFKRIPFIQKFSHATGEEAKIAMARGGQPH
ncbi:MAG TPA: hypothetical protein VGT05_04980 [Patescibacteria group bacterium]|nr:hypothetical protein [Patescibacteria group bacterium]